MLVKMFFRLGKPLESIHDVVACRNLATDLAGFFLRFPTVLSCRNNNAPPRVQQRGVDL